MRTYFVFSGIERHLRRLLRDTQCLRFDWLVAFLTEAGFRSLEGDICAFLARADHQPQSRILLSLKDGFNSPNLLRSLCEFAQSHGNLEIRVSLDSEFHAKVLVFDQGQSCSVIIGSSNLTASGLSSTGEASVELHGSKRGAIVKFRG